MGEDVGLFPADQIKPGPGGKEFETGLRHVHSARRGQAVRSASRPAGAGAAHRRRIIELGRCQRFGRPVGGLLDLETSMSSISLRLSFRPCRSV